jgi:gliding motility-associated lipoprotein GldH
MRAKQFILLLIIPLTLLACGRGKIFEEHKKTDNMAWDRFEVISFDIPIEKTGVPYDLIFAMRHHTDIPFDEVEINFTMRTPGGETRSRDYIIRIRDREGNLVGDGMGALWDIRVPMKEGYVFSDAGTCKVEIANRMHRLKTVGIMEIGFIVRESDD